MLAVAGWAGCAALCLWIGGWVLAAFASIATLAVAFLAADVELGFEALVELHPCAVTGLRCSRRPLCEEPTRSQIENSLFDDDDRRKTREAALEWLAAHSSPRSISAEEFREAMHSSVVRETAEGTSSARALWDDMRADEAAARQSAATRDAGATEVAQILGNTVETLRAHYLHASVDTARPAAAAIRSAMEEHSESATFGIVPGRIKAAREAAGFSMRKLAEVIGVTGSAVSEWERDKARPTVESLHRLARATDKSMGFFCGEAGR